jgi:hypothetical protein
MLGSALAKASLFRAAGLQTGLYRLPFEIDLCFLDLTWTTPATQREACLGKRRLGPPNGSDAKLHGQGPRAEATAARGAPACEARDARRVTP